MSPGEPISIPDLGNAGACDQCIVCDRQALYSTELHLNLLPSWFKVLFGKHSSKKQKKKKKKTFTQHPLSRKVNYPPPNWMRKYKEAPLVITALTVSAFTVCYLLTSSLQHVLDCFSVAVIRCWPNSTWERKGLLGLSVLFDLQIISGSQRRNLMAGIVVEAMEGCCLLACSHSLLSSFLIWSRTT